MIPALVVPMSGICLRFYIMLTCPCDLDPLTPHFYIKTVFYRGIHYFLIFASIKHSINQNHLIEEVLTRTHNLCFE